MKLSRRVQQIEPSLTVAIDTRAKALKAEGADIVSLGAGEPDFDTPEAIEDAAVEAIRAHKTRYVAPDGILPLKKAICAKLGRENGLSYEPDQIVVTSGAKHAVNNAVAALVDPGDKAVVLAPHWVTYPALVKLYGGEPVVVRTPPENGFHPVPEDVDRACGEGAKLLILNSPCNPSGAVYTRDELSAIAEICVRRDLAVISDEIYEHLVYGGAEHVSIASFPGMAERTVVVNGVSKAYAMTGWRIGYTASPRELARAMARLQGQTTHHPATPCQHAALAALEGGLGPVERMRKAFERRRALFVSELRSIPGLVVPEPEGAFYVFADVSKWTSAPDLPRRLGSSSDSGSVALCEWLLEHERLAVVPGAAFGVEHRIRFSYAASEETLLEAARRLRRGLAAVEGILR